MEFSDLADPLNARANEIGAERIELERQQELEREKSAERSRDSGMGHGL